MAKKVKLIQLSDFVENPDNPSTITAEAFDRLVKKLKRVPDGLRAHRIAYVTDHSAGKFVVLSGNKRLRALKAIFGENAEIGGAVCADWFQNITLMTEAQRREFIIDANTSDGEWDVDKLLAEYDQGELYEVLGEDALKDLLAEASEAHKAESAASEEVAPEAPPKVPAPVSPPKITAPEAPTRKPVDEPPKPSPKSSTVAKSSPSIDDEPTLSKLEEIYRIAYRLGGKAALEIRRICADALGNERAMKIVSEMK